MDYNEWKFKLFEDVYPQTQLTHGAIESDKHSSDHLIIKWGTTHITIDILDFYDDKCHSPLKKIKKWVYTNVPFIAEESDYTYIVYNPRSRAYDSHTLRPLGVVYCERSVDPHDFSTFNNPEKLKEITVGEMNGTILCLYTKETQIPSLATVSNRHVFKALIDEFMDYSDSLTLLLPDSIKNNHVFAGHHDSIARLSEDFSNSTVNIMSAGEWFNTLDMDLKRKGKHV